VSLLESGLTFVSIIKLDSRRDTAFKSFPELKWEGRIPTGLKMLKSDYPAQELRLI
jgi:hypothetical protein